MHENITYNVLQKETIMYVDEDVNVIIQAPTSSGKTIVAEQYIDWAIRNRKKAIYLSPLKALTKEKYDEWKKWPISTRIITGDYSSSCSFSEQLFLMTNEALDSKARSGKDWLKKVGVVVCDEAHLIGKVGRGDAFEMGLMQLAEINPDCRIIFLSATFPNTETVASWLTALNGKRTVIVSTKWRPVKQTLNLIRCDNNYWSVMVETESLIKKFLSQRDKQILVFVHSHKAGNTLAEKFGCPFHNAKLSKEERERIEEQYREKKIRLLISTSTLAYGVNLPADIGIICGGARGMELIEPYDLTQMAGRIGRYGLSTNGEVFFVFHKNYADDLYRQVIQTPSIISVLPTRLYFHIVNLIWRKGFQKKDLYSFFSRSLAAHQGRLHPSDVDDAVRMLAQYRIILNIEGNISTLKLAHAAASYYLDPIDLWHMVRNLAKKPQTNEEIAKAFATTPTNAAECSVPSSMKMPVDLPYTKQAVIATALNQWLSGIDPDPWANLVISTFSADIERQISGLKMAGVNAAYCDQLLLSFQNGVPLSLSGLIKYPGIGRKTAMKLFALNVTDEESFLKEEIAIRKNLGASIFTKVKNIIDAKKAGKIIINF